MKKRNVKARQCEAWMRRAMKGESSREYLVPLVVSRHEEAKRMRDMERA